MSELYPLKFEPQLKEKIWGGSSIVSKYNKAGNPDTKYGECWEISSMSGNISVVKNGYLAGNNLEEIIEVYMGEIVGDSIYETFGVEFPLLIKLIDAKSDLSIQVHPDNELALERHNAYGKTEMWYILEAQKGSRILAGFRKKTTRQEYLESLENDSLTDLICSDICSPGDVFFNPPGTVHAIMKGITLFEIQQASDITYRINDWKRVDKKGNPRELHTDMATDAIDFDAYGSNKSSPSPVLNSSLEIGDCEFFTTNLDWFDQPIEKNYYSIDSFIVYICIEGDFIIRWGDHAERVAFGETVLLPAAIKEAVLDPVPSAKILEVYIKNR